MLRLFSENDNSMGIKESDILTTAPFKLSFSICAAEVSTK
jgi:hypothetical protein